MRIDPESGARACQLLTDNDLTEIEVEDGDRRIKVKREPAAIFGAAAPGLAPAASSPCRAPPMHGKEDWAPEPEIAGQSVKSPMVGTAYLSAEPSAKPFVDGGRRGEGRATRC